MIPASVPVFLLLGLAAAGNHEAGSAACAPCHRAIYNAYSRTPMAMSSGRAGSSAFPEKFDGAEFSHERSGVRYRVSRERENYSFDFDKASPEATIHGSRPLEFFIGSGAVGRSYLFAVDGFLYQAPVSYYSGPGKWGLSPGYQQHDRLYLNRAVEPGCLECHASRLQPRPGTQNGFATPPFLEPGVSCERCHGPGESHIAKMKPGRTGASPEIVNPAKLDPSRRESVCAQCHLCGQARIVKAQSFRPGERISGYAAVFVWSGGDPEMKVTSHFENLARSKCKRAGGDRLWCGTCHEAHSTPSQSAFRTKCLQCHETAACKESQTRRRERQDNCIECHMPRNPVSDVEHAVYTDHSIPRRPRPFRASSGSGETLVPFGSSQASTRDLALAYASLAGIGYQSRAEKLLRAAQDESPDDVQVLLHLAYIYGRTSREEKAIPLYERVLRADPAQTVAAVNLASALIKRGRAAEAMRLWKDALSRSPGLEAASLNLASAQFRSGDLSSAEITLVKTLNLNPDNSVARKLLADVRKAAPTRSPRSPDTGPR